MNDFEKYINEFVMKKNKQEQYEIFKSKIIELIKGGYDKAEIDALFEGIYSYGILKTYYPFVKLWINRIFDELEEK